MEWIKQVEIIREIAKKRCLSGGENFSDAWFAAAVGVSPQVMNGWLKKGSKPSKDNLASIGKAFNLSSDWLLYGQGEPEPRPGNRPDTPTPAAAMPIPEPAPSELSADLAAIRHHLEAVHTDEATIRDALLERIRGGAGKSKGVPASYDLVREPSVQLVRAAEPVSEYGKPGSE